jgi:hypothetical protein
MWFSSTFGRFLGKSTGNCQSTGTFSSNVFRAVFLSNLTPLLVKAKAKELQISDSDQQWVASAHLGSIMHDTLSALPSDLRLSRQVYAFSLAVWGVTGRRYLLCGVLRLFNDLSVILGPFCLRGLVSTMAPV